jgi:hypothetical protein
MSMSAIVAFMTVMATQHVQIQKEVTTVPVMRASLAMDLFVKVK